MQSSTPVAEPKDDVQQVEGFGRVIAGKRITLPEYITDYRGEVQGWIGQLWWETGTDPVKHDLTWETAISHDRKPLRCLLHPGKWPQNRGSGQGFH